MTYCVALNLEEGLMFASDSRTNGGVDDLRGAGKMRVFAVEGERVVVTLSAGNLSVTQNALNLLAQRAKHDPDRAGIENATSMFEIAQHIGDAMREIRARDESYLRANYVDPNGSFIVGGQIKGEDARTFLVYSEGNFIETTPETPYFQTGETKFGKPIIDRVITRQTPLDEATKAVLVSMDSTMRSNLSVGPPLDILIYRRDSLTANLRWRLEEDDPYLVSLNQTWNQTLRQGVKDLAGPEWLENLKG